MHCYTCDRPNPDEEMTQCKRCHEFNCDHCISYDNICESCKIEEQVKQDLEEGII